MYKKRKRERKKQKGSRVGAKLVRCIKWEDVLLRSEKVVYEKKIKKSDIMERDSEILMRKQSKEKKRLIMLECVIREH